MTQSRSIPLSLLLLALGCGGGAADGGAPGAMAGAAGAAGAGGAGSASAKDGATPHIAAKAAHYLTGRFDSSADAATNPNHFAISLVICRADVPALGDDVLYVEQAQVATPDKPYRQRLYVVEPGADAASQAVSRVFELEDPTAFVGWCDASSPSPIQVDDAEEKTGCAVHLTFDQSTDSFAGGTSGSDCSSTLAGASYATSEVELSKATLLSWDRGFDQSGAQVWGATDGPYVFQRSSVLED